MNWGVWATLLVVVLFVAGMPFIIWRAVRSQDRPSPLIDRRRAFTATVVGAYDNSQSETAEANVQIEYHDALGEKRRAWLGDVIDARSLDRFVPGTQWRIYAFDPPGPRVVLTQDYEEIERAGWNLDSVYAGSGGLSGPVDPGSGSPFPYRPRGPYRERGSSNR